MLCPGSLPAGPHLGHHRSPDAPGPEGRPSQSELPASAVSEVRQVLPSGSGVPGPAPCMISAIRWGGGPVTFTSPIRNTTASGASTTSPPTYPAWPHPRPATPIGSWPWPSGWSSRTAYPIRPPVGTSGATTASSSPSATIQNWVEAGGKKGGRPDRDRLPRLGPRRLLGIHRR